jgi:hypothetical protein
MCVKNPQSGFPLLPTFCADESNDILIEQTKNIGLLPYLDQLDDNKDARGEKGKGKINILKEIGSSVGISYTILGIGKRRENKEITCFPGKSIEVREITIISAPPHFYFSADESSDDDDCYDRAGKKNDQKEKEKEKEEKILEVVPREEKALSRILHIPIVQDLTWKKLCVLILKKCATKQDIILKQLSVPVKKIDPEVATILFHPANKEILDLFNTLRAELNDMSNGAYVEIFIYGILSFISVNNLTPTFPRLFGVGRGQEMSSLTGKNDVHIAPSWKEYAFLQYTESYYADILAMYSSLDLEMFMADIFQLVFGLDFAQRKVGFIHNNFDIRKAIGYVKMDPCTLLQFQWDDDYYHIPTNGKMLKILNMENATITVNGVQHSVTNINSAGTSQMNFNTDLVRLAATIKRVIQEKQWKIVSTHPEITTTFNKMIDQWTNCGNPLSPSSSTGAVNNIGLRLSPKELEMQNYRLKCLQSDDENDQCVWKKFANVPSHTECTSATPYKQKEFFKMFLVDKSKINKDGLIYQL